MVIKTLYFVLPGLVANMMPVFARKYLKFLAVPVDLGHQIGGRPIFGPHKTYRGFIFGIAGAILIAWAQKFIFMQGYWHSIAYIDYSSSSPLYIGLAMGFGALFGDLVKSFFKRRMGVAPGNSWLFWDQVDFIIGIIMFCMLIKPLTWSMIILLLVAGPILHFMVTYCGYILKIRKHQW